VIAYIIDISRRKEIEEMLLQQKADLEKSNLEVEKLNDELEQKVMSRTLELKTTLQALEVSKAEVEAALNKEKELSDLKTRFVSMASHEFRTPLSTILSSVSLVAKYKLAEEQDKRDKHIQRIKSAVNNLTDILNEFLSIGRIEEGRVQTNFSSFNIREQIQLVCNEMQTIMKPGQRFNYVHKGPQKVYLDLSLFRNVLINLISNAIKFSFEHSPIDIHTEVTESAILISIKDYGLGIPDEDRKHLFERFFRAQNVTNIQGTGLGLHIVSKYVELMNGDIQVESELEKGTQFNIRFNYEQDPVDRRQP
jgi:signal transduction histidine kinase